MIPLQIRQQRAAIRSAIASVELEGVKISPEVTQILQQHSQAPSPATRAELVQAVLQAHRRSPAAQRAKE